MADFEGEEAPEITLIDEAGREMGFRVHDALEVDEGTYFLVESLVDPDVVLVLKEGSDRLESVEGAERERVLALLEAEDSDP